MQREQARHRARTGLPWLAAAVLSALVVLTVPAASAQEKCTCKHLDAIRKQRTAAEGVRDYYRRSMDELFAKEKPILQSRESVEQREAKLRELRSESDRAIAADTTTEVNFDN